MLTETPSLAVAHRRPFDDEPVLVHDQELLHLHHHVLGFSHPPAERRHVCLGVLRQKRRNLIRVFVEALLRRRRRGHGKQVRFRPLRRSGRRGRLLRGALLLRGGRDSVLLCGNVLLLGVRAGAGVGAGVGVGVGVRRVVVVVVVFVVVVVRRAMRPIAPPSRIVLIAFDVAISRFTVRDLSRGARHATRSIPSRRNKNLVASRVVVWRASRHSYTRGVRRGVRGADR